jgi:hypothetical protein
MSESFTIPPQMNAIRFNQMMDHALNKTATRIVVQNSSGSYDMLSGTNGTILGSSGSNGIGLIQLAINSIGTGNLHIKPGNYGTGSISVPDQTALILEDGATTITYTPNGGATCTIMDFEAGKITYYEEGVLSTEINMNSGTIYLRESITASEITGSIFVSGSAFYGPIAVITNIIANNITGSNLISGSLFRGPLSLIENIIADNITGSLISGSNFYGPNANITNINSIGVISGSNFLFSHGLLKDVTYLIYSGSGYYWAENGKNGEIDYGGSGSAGSIDGTNASSVINAAILGSPITGSIIFVKSDGKDVPITSPILIQDKTRLTFVTDGVNFVNQTDGDYTIKLLGSTWMASVQNHILNLSISGSGKEFVHGTNHGILIRNGLGNEVGMLHVYGLDRGIALENTSADNCWTEHTYIHDVYSVYCTKTITFIPFPLIHYSFDNTNLSRIYMDIHNVNSCGIYLPGNSSVGHGLWEELTFWVNSDNAAGIAMEVSSGEFQLRNSILFQTKFETFASGSNRYGLTTRASLDTDGTVLYTSSTGFVQPFDMIEEHSSHTNLFTKVIDIGNYNKLKTFLVDDYDYLLPEAEPYSYLIYRDNLIYYAKNGLTGKADFSTFTDIASVINQAIVAAPSGSTIYVKNNNENWSISSTITITDKQLTLLSDGVKIVPTGSIFAFTVTSPTSFLSYNGSKISGFQIDGTNKTNSGIQILDAYQTEITNIKMNSVNIGIQIANSVASTGHAILDNIYINNPSIGMDFPSTSNGGTNARNIIIRLFGTGSGIRIPQNGSIVGATFSNVEMFTYSDSVNFIDNDGNIEKASFDGLSLQSFVSSPTAINGFILGSHTVGNAYIMRPVIFNGDFTNYYSRTAGNIFTGSFTSIF